MKKYPCFLLAVFLLLFLVMGISPASRSVWVAEVIPVVLAAAAQKKITTVSRQSILPGFSPGKAELLIFSAPRKDRLPYKKGDCRSICFTAGNGGTACRLNVKTRNSAACGQTAARPGCSLRP